LDEPSGGTDLLQTVSREESDPLAVGRPKRRACLLCPRDRLLEPPGRYVVEPIEDEAPTLSPDEEAGIQAALESFRQGRVIDAKRARDIIDAALGR
jgi:hypothetical protein